MTNTTTTPTMPAAPVTPASASPATPAAAKRPLTLVIGAALLALLGLLSFATPFLPRGRVIGAGGFGGGGAGFQRTPPAGGFQRTPPAGGSQPGGVQDGQGGFGQNGANDQGSTTTGQGRQRAGLGQAGILGNLMLSLRIGLGLVSGLFALIAALGVWRRRKWGRNLTVLVAIATLVVVLVTFVQPLVMRYIRTFTIWLTFFTLPTWQAVVVGIGALAAAVLVLLPVSQKAYVVVRKERRVA